MIKPRRAALYLRVSTSDQHPENQRPEIEDVVARRGLQVVLVEEETKSTRCARPAFARILDAARRRRFDVLVIWAIDRLGRDMVGNLLTVLELDRLGVEVISVREAWLETGDGPIRKLLLGVFSWFAEQERDQRSARTRAGMERARREGKAIGRPSRSVNTVAARSMLADGGKPRSVAKAFGVSRATLYRRLASQKVVPPGDGSTS